MGVLHKTEEQEKIEVKKRILKTLKLYFGTNAVSQIAENTKLKPLQIYRYFKMPNSNAIIETEILRMLREAQERQQAFIEAKNLEMQLSESHVD